MQREYFVTANTEQFVKELVDEILSELRGVGREHIVELVRPKKFVCGSYEHTRTEYGIGMAFGASTDLTDYSGDAEIFIHAESKVHQDRGISVIVKDWDGEKSKLTVSYRDAEDWELVKETWQLFEAQIKQRGWELTSTMPRQWVTKRLGDFAYAPMITQVEASKEILTLGDVEMDDIEIIISGTPHEFASFAIDFGETQRAANPDAPRYYISNALQDSGRLIIECVQGGGVKDGKHEAVTHLGQITALKIPNDKSHLRVVPNAENATAFLREWELLRQEMIRLGFAKRSGQDWVDEARREVEKMQGKAKTDTPPQKAPVLTLQRKPNNQVKRLPRRLKDGLNCNANAADVVGVLFGGVGIRKMEITGAQCAGEFELHCATSLSINTSLDSDYVVFISLTMREIESIETGREELLYLLWDREVAEIKVKQEQAGHCRMELYIDENEHQWMHSPFQMRKDIPMEQDQNGYENKSHGLPLIDECWRILKEEWVKHETAKTKATAPALKQAALVTASRQEPTKPNKDAPRDEWFGYYHACKQAKIKYTLQDLAKDLSLDSEYVRQLHAQYKAQHET